MTHLQLDVSEDEYRFASEMAARFLERKHETTLDHIICDPGIVAEFDAMAERISPGFRPVQYRIAALNVWTNQRVQPEQVSQAVYPEEVRVALFSERPTDQIPQRQGLYLLHQANLTLYVGETKDLKVRLAKHGGHAEREGGEHWVWKRGAGHVILEYRVLPQETSTTIRRALALDLIRSRRPVFNIYS